MWITSRASQGNSLYQQESTWESQLLHLMLSITISFFLLFALLSPKTLILSIPQATNPTALLAGNNTLNGEVHYYPRNPFATGPSAQDCISAVRRLSSSHIHGTFHGPIGGDDQLRLPVSKSSGWCQVLIGLRSLAPEEGTWLALNMAATQLIAACVDREGFLAKRGGWTDAGDHNGVIITLQASRLMVEDVGNGTIAGEEA